MITIYCHIHRASGRRYVGQTRYSMEKRWRQHIYNAIRGDCRVFAAAILEYGPDAFDHAVLEVCETSASACLRVVMSMDTPRTRTGLPPPLNST